MQTKTAWQVKVNNKRIPVACSTPQTKEQMLDDLKKRFPKDKVEVIG